MMTSTPILRVLSENVRGLRRARGWSQEDLAQRCGLHRTYVGAVERAERNITLESLSKLATALGAEPGALISSPMETASG